MRIDLLLKSLCLVRSRSEGRRACLSGAVRIGGAVVKPSREAARGDVIDIRYPHRELVIELLDVPGRQVPRKECPSWYRVIREREL